LKAHLDPLSEPGKEQADNGLPVPFGENLQPPCEKESLLPAGYEEPVLPDNIGKKHKTTLIERYEKVISVLMKYGFADLVTHPPFNRLIPKWERIVPKHEGRPVTTFTKYERMRMVCEELGTTFIKFAQIASNRPDLLPEELIEELSTFQDRAVPLPAEVIRDALIRELGRPPETIFEQFDYEPVASASISQVHRARLKGGKDVVLKVQRPGIHETVELDIAILRQLARLLERHFAASQSYQPLELVKMFEKSILKELDFTIEAANVRRFEIQFRGNPNIYVPFFYPEYSTKRVLCLEYIEGVKITNLEELAKIGMTGPELALKGISLYFEQVFDHGFFHADPHPGNIFVMPDKKICFIDFGMMGSVVDADQLLLGDLLLAVHNQDVQGLKKSLLRFSFEDAQINEKDLEYDIIDFFQQYSHIGIEDIDGQKVMAALNSLFFDYKIRIPSNLLLLLKALVIIEGVGLMLDPKYDIIGNIEPYATRLLVRKFSATKLSKNLLKSLSDLSKLATSLPEDAQEVIKKIKQGKLHIEFEHKGLDNLEEMLGILSKRIAFAIVLGSLILGSSLLMVANVPPYFRNIPALGFFGFIISGFLGLRLVVSIMRRGKF
jgi:ubiquinone biosynthesis protein